MKKSKILYINFVLIFVIITSIVLIGWKMTSMALPDNELPNTFVGDVYNTEDLGGLLEYIPNIDLSLMTNWYSLSDNIPAFCMKRGSYNIFEHTMTKGERLSAPYVSIIKNGWIDSGKSSEDYYITQTALWWYIDRYEQNLDDGSQILEYDSGDNEVWRSLSARSKAYLKTSSDAMAVKIRNLVTTAEQVKNTSYSVSLNASNKKLTLSSDNNFFESEWISVKKVTDLTSFSIVDINAPSGTVFVDESGAVKTTFNASEKFKVRVPKDKVSASNNSISFKVNGIFKYLEGYRYLPDLASVQDVSPAILFEEQKTVKSAALSLEIDTVKIGFAKTDAETGEYVSGAKLQVQTKKGELVDSWTSNDTVHYINNMVAGDYLLVETTAPSGYIKNTSKISFTVQSGQEKIVEMANKYTKIEVSKIDASTNKLIKGATLVIKDIEGKEKYRIITKEEPIEIIKIPVGTYTLQEVEAPSGYVLNTTPITFKVTDDGKIQKIIIKNDYTKISIVDQSVTVDSTLEGVTFCLVDSTGKTVTKGKWTTTKNNMSYTINNLEKGKYVLKELEVPDGYVLNEEGIEFEITGGTSELMFPNDFTKVKISKKDMANDKELPGATIQLKNKKGKVIDEWVSTEEEHYIEKLPVGTYTLIETIVPEGYEPNSNSLEFKVLETGKIQTTTLYNIPKVTVPDTVSNIPVVVYILGSVIIAGGVGLVYVNTRKSKKK